MPDPAPLRGQALGGEGGGEAEEADPWHRNSTLRAYPRDSKTAGTALPGTGP